MGEAGSTGVLKENSLTQHSGGQILGMLRLRAGSGFAGTRSPLSTTEWDVVFKPKTLLISHAVLPDCAKTNSAAA